MLVPKSTFRYHLDPKVHMQLKVMTKRSSLGQYYTPSDIAAQIVNKALKIMGKPPSSTLELAAGEGHLLAALEMEAPCCKMYAIDVDDTNCSTLKSKHPEYETFNADATKPIPFLEEKIFDLALGNPPFLSSIPADKYIQFLLKTTLNLDVDIGKRIRMEYIFICQYLKYLEKNGLLAIILPDSIISGVKSCFFRDALLKNLKVEEIIELKGNSFSKTEAKTHVLFIRKCSPDISKTKLSSFYHNESQMWISNVALVDRMDFTFHKKNMKTTTGKKLVDYATIERGKLPHKLLKNKQKHFIHSTTFEKDFFIDAEIFYDQSSYILKGDIIMCRVGTRVAGKVRIYNGDPVMFTDCIYKIRFKDENIKNEFLRFITSSPGQASLLSLLRGVCSKYITKNDLGSIIF